MQKRGGDDCFISNLSSLEPHRRAMHAENCNYNKGGGLMISALVHGSSVPGLSPGWGHCVVLLGKTIYSHSASPNPGV